MSVDTKGRVTAGNTLTASDIPALDWSKITTGKPTTLAGYGITDALGNLDPDLLAIAALTGTSGYLKKTAADTWALDTSTFLTANQNITFTGDATGSGTTAVALTLANSGVTAGTYPKVTVDAKGRVTSGAALAAADIPALDWSKITTGKPTTLAGYGITDAPTTTGTGASGTWGINITGSSASCTGNAATATYLSSTQQTNIITGAYASLSMSQDGGATQGSFVARAAGAGDTNLAGMTFWNDAYALKIGVRADGYIGIGGWSRPAWSWYSDPSGNMVAAGNVTAYSDPRLKENFVKIEQPLEIVKKLDGGTFTWKTGYQHTAVKAGTKDYGVLADQVEAVMPEIVTESIEIEGESYKTVDYSKIVPVLIEAIKALNDKVESLEQQLSELRK